MKRDYELIRKMLLEIEEKENPLTFARISCPEYSHEKVVFHVEMLERAGLIYVEGIYSPLGPMVRALTWEGHEFLDQARNETVWKKAMGYVKDKGGSVSFTILAEVLKKFAMQHFE